MFRGFNRAGVGALLAEFLGTAILVSVALVLTETTAVSYFIATSLAVTLAAIVLAFGGVSGSHVNPAITFGMWTARRIGTLRAVGYIAAQMLGGLAAWQLYQYLVNKPLPTKTVHFDTHVWVAELIGTFILALGFSAAISRVLDALQSAAVYSAALFVGIIVASVGSAGLLNPAMALGVRSWGTVYLLGPLVGGLLGVNLYYLLFAPEESRFALGALRAPRRGRSSASTVTSTKVSNKSAAATKPAKKTAPRKAATSSRRRTTRR
jgi:glycerol uptake facilitator-like aquaporin